MNLYGIFQLMGAIYGMVIIRALGFVEGHHLNLAWPVSILITREQGRGPLQIGQAQ